MDDLDAAIAVVYAQPPSAFVPSRSALVKELKAAKRRDEAAMVGSLRRPTKLAWALGEAVRRVQDVADAYFGAIDALAEPGVDLRQRTADLRSAAARLAGGAEGVDPGEATAALLATAADPEAITALRLGRLAEVPAAGGFGLAAFAHGAGPDQATEPAEPGAASASDEGEPEEGQEEAGAAADERARQEQERARAEQRAALEAQRDAAEAAEAAAAEQVAAAQAAVDQAQAELARATSLLDEARVAAAAVAEQLREAEA